MARNDFRILLVDDDWDLCEMLKDALELHDMRVDVAYTACEGLEKVEKTEYTIAIVDILLPDMNGRELCKKIKSQSPKTKIIIITGYASEMIIEEEYKENVLKCLYKPFDLSTLYEAIDEQLK